MGVLPSIILLLPITFPHPDSIYKRDIGLMLMLMMITITIVSLNQKIQSHINPLIPKGYSISHPQKGQMLSPLKRLY